MRIIVFFVLLLLIANQGQAQNTGLDPDFANGGIAFLPNAIGPIINCALQSTGDIIIGGKYRYHPNGTLDSLVHTLEPSYAFSIQGDDKILVGLNNQLWRHHINGEVDSSFGNTGSVINTSTQDIVCTLFQPDNKIILVGTGYGDTHDTLIGTQKAIILIRYFNDGSIDSSFGENGIVTDPGTTPHFNFDAKGAVLQPDGKIVVGILESTAGGGAFTASRYMSDGKLDTAFGVYGYARVEGLELLNSIALQPDGRVALAGADFGSQGNPQGVPFILARFNFDGSPDTSLGPEGVRFYYWPDGGEANKCRDIIALSDNKLLLGGRAWNAVKENYDFALLKLLPNGDPDLNFGIAGYLTTSIRNINLQDEIRSLTLQPDGKILASGSSDCEEGNCPTPTIVRYMPNGKTSLNDFKLNNKSFKLYPNPVTDEIHIEGKTGIKELLLCDIAGKVLYNNKQGVNTIRMQQFTAGTYLLVVTNISGGIERFKVVKQ